MANAIEASNVSISQFLNKLGTSKFENGLATLRSTNCSKIKRNQCCAFNFFWNSICFLLNSWILSSASPNAKSDCYGHFWDLSLYCAGMGTFFGRFLKTNFSKEHKNPKGWDTVGRDMESIHDHTQPEWRGNGVPGRVWQLWRQKSPKCLHLLRAQSFLLEFLLNIFKLNVLGWHWLKDPVFIDP